MVCDLFLLKLKTDVCAWSNVDQENGPSPICQSQFSPFLLKVGVLCLNNWCAQGPQLEPDMPVILMGKKWPFWTILNNFSPFWTILDVHSFKNNGQLQNPSWGPGAQPRLSALEGLGIILKFWPQVYENAGNLGSCFFMLSGRVWSQWKW